MMDYSCINRKLTIALLFTVLWVLNACTNPEEEAKDHLQRGIELFKEGEFDKAKLELKTSSQADKNAAETYYYLALMDEKNRQFKAMRDNLIKAIELAPGNIDARLKLGKVQLRLGEVDKALEQAETILQDSSQNVGALTLKASALSRQQKPEESLLIVDKVLNIDPNYTDALSLKSAIYMEKENFDEALALINAAIKSNDHDVSLRLFKIQLDAKTKNIDAVIDDYQNLIELSPDNQDFKITLAKIYSQAGKKKEAENLLRMLVDADPDKAKLKLLLLDFLSASASDKVSEQFHQFAEKHKDQSQILFELSNWMIARKNFDEARSTLNRIIEIEDHSNVGLSAKTLLAKLALEEKDFDKSQKLIEEILKANSNYDDAKILQARLLLVKEQYDEAIDLLNRVLWNRPDSEEALVLLGQSFLVKEDHKQANDSFTRALKINPANLQALAYVYDKALKAKNIKYAKEVLIKAIRLTPGNIVLLEKLAKLNLVEKNWNNAQVTIKEIAKSPNPLAPRLAKYLEGQLQQEQGNFVKAIAIYKELLDKFPGNRDAITNMARCYQSLNKQEEMVVFLNGLLSKNPNNISAGLVLSDLYLINKEFDKASAVLTKLIKNKTKIPQVYMSLANVKLVQNESKAAISVYLEGLKQNPDNIKLSLSLASLYELQKDYDAAIAIYEALLRKHPRLDLAANNLAAILIEHFEEEETLKRAVQLVEKFKDSKQAYYRDTYAWALVKQGNISEGLNILNQISIAEPDVPVFKYHLGVAQYKSGNHGAAMSELKQALELTKRKGYFSDKKAAEELLQEIIAAR
ncbi:MULTISPECIES: tetratricopeptide repeat protein [Methylobacter]|uniref:tetratricopeptide repeat protein n=1 Tax=Methylobacter TaxID=429 RepID=UPI00037E0EDE|nr:MULTISPECIES: tetratricopeptide repeat protein [Methylobacter]